MKETVVNIDDTYINTRDHCELSSLISSNSPIIIEQKKYSIIGINLEKSYNNKNFLNLFNSNENNNVLDKLNINIEKGKM